MSVRLSISPSAAITCGIVAAAMVLGGGGSSAPGSELLLELVIAIAAVAWLLTRRLPDGKCPSSALVLAVLVLALPALQLVPLPPALWQALPGRTVEAAGLGVVDAARAWMPWTVSPPRTSAALFATIPAALVICLAATLDHRGRRALLATVAVVGSVSLLLGALQLADGAERTWRFYVDNPGYLNGFQANRNAEADVLLITLAALAGALAPARLGRTDQPWRLPLLVGGTVALLLGCLLTGSRAGIALIVPVVLLLFLRRGGRARPRTLLPVSLVAGAIVLVGAIVLTQARSGALQSVADRFTMQRDVRADLWRDTLPALRSVWPAGSGVGTFRPVFEAREPLTSVDPTRPVRAHNDYLEFMLEGGVVAVALLVACMAALVIALARAARVAQARDRPTLRFVAATFVVITLHSLVDYPLRSMAIAVLGAVAAGLLFAIMRDAGGHVAERGPDWSGHGGDGIGSG